MSGHNTTNRDDTSDLDRNTDRLHGESLYRSLLNSVPACLNCKDRDGRLLFVNETFAALFGKSADKLIGKKITDLYTQDFSEDAQKEDETVMRTGQLVEDVFEDRVGEESFYFTSRKGPVRNKQGEIIGVSAIFWDITKRRTAELALLAEREKLRAAKEADDEVNKAIFDFLESSRKSPDEIPAPLQVVCETLESYLAQKMKIVD